MSDVGEQQVQMTLGGRVKDLPAEGREAANEDPQANTAQERKIHRLIHQECG